MLFYFDRGLFSICPHSKVVITQPGFTCAIHQYNSVLTTLTNVTIYTSAGCGVLEGAGGGTIIDNMQIKRGAMPNGATQPRLMSTIRDGFHINGPKYGTTVKNCFVEYTGDDGINVRSEFPFIISIMGNTITLSISWAYFFAGDTLWVYDGASYKFITSVSVVSHTIETNLFTVNSTSDLSLGMRVISPEHMKYFQINNNVFQDIEGRGIVATGLSILIENNIIARSTIGGIWVGAEMGTP